MDVDLVRQRSDDAREDAKRTEQYRKLLARHRENLNVLELQAVGFGLAIPLDVANAIAHEKEQIRFYLDALSSPLSASRLAAEDVAVVTLKRIDRQDAAAKQREVLDQQSRVERQQEIDARDQQRDRIIRGVFWGIAALCLLSLIAIVILIVIAQLLFAVLARG